MSVKTDRPQVRTAEELERKYNFAGIEKNVKQSTIGLTKVSNELFEFVKAVAGDMSTLERQLDGEIDTWYGDAVPTLLNEPASNWTALQYPNHVDDLYYNRNTGKTYVFSVDNNIYSWELTDNNFLAEILAIANRASETADNKKAVFLETQPIPPYDNGDLWISNKKLYVCQLAREYGDTYHDGDFVIATDYVDGTQASANARNIEIISGKITELLATNDEFKINFKTTDEIIDEHNTIISEYTDYIRFVGGNIVLGKENSNFTLTIENDKITINYNNVPISNWTQDKFTVSQLNLRKGQSSSYYAFIPRQNGSMSFRKVVE